MAQISPKGSRLVEKVRKALKIRYKRRRATSLGIRIKNQICRELEEKKFVRWNPHVGKAIVEFGLNFSITADGRLTRSSALSRATHSFNSSEDLPHYLKISSTKSSTSCPPTQSFHSPPSITHQTLPLTLTVQLVLTPAASLLSMLFLNSSIPLPTSLTQEFNSSKSTPCSKAQFSTCSR